MMWLIHWENKQKRKDKKGYETVINFICFLKKENIYNKMVWNFVISYISLKRFIFLSNVRTKILLPFYFPYYDILKVNTLNINIFELKKLQIYTRIYISRRHSLKKKVNLEKRLTKEIFRIEIKICLKVAEFNFNRWIAIKVPNDMYVKSMNVKQYLAFYFLFFSFS